jgi:hypothetical protein
MDFLIALKVFILFLLPLPGMVLTAVIFYGLDNGLNGLVLTFIYLLNSITVVSIFNVFVGWIFERPRIKAKLIKKTEKWRERVKIYLGHHGLALGLMLAAYFVTWWAAVLVGRLLGVKTRMILLMSVLGDVLLFITHLVLVMGVITILPNDLRLYLLGIILVAIFSGYLLKRFAEKIERAD